MDEVKALARGCPAASEYRCYGELTHEETARMMAVDDCTLRRWWERAHPVLVQRLLQLLNAGIAEEQRP